MLSGFVDRLNNQLCNIVPPVRMRMRRKGEEEEEEKVEEKEEEEGGRRRKKEGKRGRMKMVA